MGLQAIRIVVYGDIEAAKRGRKQQRREVGGRERGGHGHGRQQRFQGEHGLDLLACGKDIRGGAEPDRMAEQIAHRPSGVFDRRLGGAVRAIQVRCTPVMLPDRSVTAAIRAGQVSSGASSSAR
jgi:hypothetical protein